LKFSRENEDEQQTAESHFVIKGHQAQQSYCSLSFYQACKTFKRPRQDSELGDQMSLGKKRTKCSQTNFF
jgi:hypothetical protein